jgi:ribosomal-protein-serine acetyltransferase
LCASNAVPSPDVIKVDKDILIRWPTPEDAAAIFDLIHRNRDHLAPWFLWMPIYRSLENLLPWIAERPTARAEGIENPPLIIYRGTIAGGIGFYGGFDIKNKSCDIGYWIGREFEGRGIVTPACKAVIKYAFNDLEMNRVQLRIAKENTRSHAIARRLGMTY